MAFHITTIIAGQNVRLVFSWNRLPIYEQFEKHLQFVDYLNLVFITLKVFLRVC